MLLAPDFFFVAIGAVFGACLRHQVADCALRRGIGPWHIAGINVIGSGVLGVASTHPSMTPRQRALIGVGFCGALTTFSTFSVDTVRLIESGRIGTAIAYSSLNNIGSIGAAYAGMRVGRRFPTVIQSLKNKVK